MEAGALFPTAGKVLRPPLLGSPARELPTAEAQFRGLLSLGARREGTPRSKSAVRPVTPGEGPALLRRHSI